MDQLWREKHCLRFWGGGFGNMAVLWTDVKNKAVGRSGSLYIFIYVYNIYNIFVNKYSYICIHIHISKAIYSVPHCSKKTPRQRVLGPSPVRWILRANILCCVESPGAENFQRRLGVGWGCQTGGGWSPQEIWMEEFFPKNPPVQLDMLDVLKNAGGNHGINHDKPAKPQLVCRSSEAWTVCSKNSGFPILSYSGDWIETINLGFMNLPVLKKTPGLMKSNNQRPWCLHCFLELMVIYHCFSLANGIPSQKLANRSWK